MREFDVKCLERLRQMFDYFDGGRDDFDADAVGGDGGDVVFVCGHFFFFKKKVLSMAVDD